MRLPARPFATGFAVAALFLGAPLPASAHGPQTLVDVSTRTVAGTTTIDAVVTYPDDDPVTDAAVTAVAVTGHGQVSVLMAPSLVSGTFTGRTVLKPGSWQVFVNVLSDSPGAGMSTLLVAEAEPTSAWSRIWAAGASAAFLAALIAICVRRRRLLPGTRPA